MRLNLGVILLALFFYPVAKAFNRPLEDVKLNCCAASQFPNLYSDPQNAPFKLSGIAIDVLSQLQDRLGFRCTSMHVFNKSNISFTEFIHEFERCTNGSAPRDNRMCSCDLGVGGWMRTRSREGRTQFLPPFEAGEIVVLTHVRNTSIANAFAFFLQAFAPRVWIVIFLLFVTFTVILLVDARFTPMPADAPRPPDSYGFVRRVIFRLTSKHTFTRLHEAAMVTFGYMIGSPEARPGPTGRRTGRQFVLRMCIVLCGLFLVLAYEASMTANLVQERVTSVFRTIADLRECAIPASDVCLPEGGAIEAFWGNAIERQKCHLDGPRVRKLGSYQEAVKAVADGRCKFLIADDLMALDALHGPLCGSVRKVGERLAWSGSSFLMPNGAAHYDALAKGMLDLLEEGRVSSAADMYERRGKCPKTESSSLKLRRLRGFFIIAFLACAALFLSMLLDPRTRDPSDPDCVCQDSRMRAAWGAKSQNLGDHVIDVETSETEGKFATQTRTSSSTGTTMQQ